MTPKCRAVILRTYASHLKLAGEDPPVIEVKFRSLDEAHRWVLKNTVFTTCTRAGILHALKRGGCYKDCLFFKDIPTKTDVDTASKEDLEKEEDLEDSSEEDDD